MPLSQGQGTEHSSGALRVEFVTGNKSFKVLFPRSLVFVLLHGESKSTVVQERRNTEQLAQKQLPCIFHASGIVLINSFQVILWSNVCSG